MIGAKDQADDSAAPTSSQGIGQALKASGSNDNEGSAPLESLGQNAVPKLEDGGKLIDLAAKVRLPSELGGGSAGSKLALFGPGDPTASMTLGKTTLDLLGPKTLSRQD